MDSLRRLPPLAPELAQCTVRAAVRVAAGQATNQVVSGAVASLVQGMIWRMTMIKLGGVAAVGLMLVGLAGYGVRVGAQHSDSVTSQGNARTESEPTTKKRDQATAPFEGIYSNIEGGTTIIAIQPDGSVVKKGEVLVELDSAALRDQLVNQQITTKSAEANFRNAKLARENADHALTAYQGDLFPREEREAKGEVDVAERELAVAQGNLELFGGTGGSIVPEQAALNRKRAELDIARAKLALEKAGNRLHILTHYTKEKQIRGLETAVRMTRSEELAKQATWELEKSKERKLERQIAACTIIAPIDGTVVHAELSRLNPAIGGPPPRIEPGSTVRERELILRIVPPPRTDPDQR
jgi:multidrug efflux pump subunit AcrA (membrane-fusion protein)